jgi:hypothetical protein
MPIPEMRVIFETAARYIDGEATVQDLHAVIGQCRALAHMHKSPEPVRQLLADWDAMVQRRWNEWGLCRDPLSEEEFVAWLREQLTFGGPAAR